MAKDYYKVLGVERNSSKEDIRRAYKELAKKYHPDINKGAGASDKFKEINEAASVLADEKKRAQYDQYGTADSNFQGFDFGGAESGFDFGNFNFDDIFDMFMGGGFTSHRRRRGGAVQGHDLRYDLDINLEDAAFGIEHEIHVPRLVKCENCHGTGAENDSDVKTCDDCKGSGYVRQTTRTPFGMFQQTGPCRTCSGEGKVIKHPCKECDGTGRLQKNTKLKISIPKGVKTGTQLRVEGEGEAGMRGGPDGDLYVFLNVKQHDIFERKGNDLYVDVGISFATAALGGEIDVPTIEGKTAKLKIPAGTQTDTFFKLKGKGVENLHGYETGDEKVRVVVDVPKNLTKKQKDILKEFDNEAEKKEPGVFKRIFG
jgi:molecular chaperone DnaJ